MAYKHFLAAALGIAVVCSHPVELQRDQYETRHDKPHAAHLPSEVTDSVLQGNEAQLPSYIEKETNRDTDNVFDARRSETGRAKRGFSLYTEGQPQFVGYNRFSMWKPPVYQISRPYFIPVYGAPGRNPIYFPPQPFNINPGTPLHNPLPNRPFTGPEYLPPKEYLPPPITTLKPTTMNFTNRFDDDDDDDRPVWDSAPASTPRPSSVIPTRPPRPQGMADFPPLVHDVGDSGTSFLSADSESSEEEIVPAPQLATPQPLQSARPAQSASRPAQSTPRTAGPSNCVWAIVSCCSASSTSVPDSCFEQRGCPGPFWGSSPCDDNNVRAAIQTASDYFKQ